MLTKGLRWALAVVGCSLCLWSCGGDSSGGGGGGGGVVVELASDPTVTYDATRGRTNVVVQFVARDRLGVPLASDDVTVTLQVDGRAVDNESVLQDSSQELTADLLYALVLDASGSMLQHTPPAFGSMKSAAQVSVNAGLALWADRPGTFVWDLCWFNDHLFRRQGSWRAEDLPSIPEPSDTAATKLYAAVEFMASELLAAQQGGTAAGPRDHHVMVVLSDGADNLSGFDDTALTPTTTRATSTGASYLEFGWPSTALADALAAIEAHPNLTVHVLAMGSNFAAEDLHNLQALATAGGGQFLRNPSSSGIASLFERVTQEFSTLQTRGASIPQQADDHVFTLVVRGLRVGGEARLSFRYRAGTDAQYLP